MHFLRIWNETELWPTGRSSVFSLPSRKIVYSAPCCRASLRNAIPKTLRLPRPRRGLAMTRLVSFMVLWHGFQNEKFEIRRRATPQRRFSESAISRGRKSAFHMRSILHLLEEQFHSEASPVLRRSHSARNYARILVHFAGLCHNSGHWARFVSFHAAFFLLN